MISVVANVTKSDGAQRAMERKTQSVETHNGGTEFVLRFAFR
jgi:hypothetical protein